MRFKRSGWAWLQKKGVYLLLLSAFALSACGPVQLANVFTPTLTPSPTITATATLTPSPTFTFTPLADTPTPTATLTPSPTATQTITPSATASITPGPSPTLTQSLTLTPSLTSTLVPSQTRTPTYTPTTTYTPTITLTPTPPTVALMINSPGLLSRLVSPIKADINAVPGADGMVRVELIGEDGRLIARQVVDFTRYKQQAIAFYPSIPFEIHSAAETARLQVLTADRAGRTIEQMSVDVILLKVGRNEIFGPALTQEPYLIRSPKDGQSVSGGILTIDGLFRPVNTSPIILEAITEDNRVLFTKQFDVPQPSGQLSHTPFKFDIPYKVSASTPVRLIFRQEGSRIPGTVALSSLLITLEP
jgi:hypothetical protein